ncbi:MAG: hypothetical protein WEC59_08235 [Salibacteraceae bacterium]
MKNTIITIALLLLTEGLVAQSTREVKTYFDYWETKIKAIEQVTDNGQMHGQQKYYYENGDLRNLFNFKFGKQDGVQKTFFHNGKLKIISNYKNDKLHGALEEYKYDKENYYLYGKAYYENDKVVRQTSYHPNGNKMEHLEANGICTQWYENGTKASEYTNVNGLANGKVTWWNRDGSIEFIGNHANNAKDGKWEYYGTDGKVIRTEYWSMGNKSGKWKILYYGDNEKWETVSESGKANYYRLINYSNKAPKSITDNSRTTFVYQAEDYYATGEKQWEGYIEDNNGDGVDFTEKIFVEVGDCKYYHENGKVSAVGTLKHNGREYKDAASIKIGSWKYYDENGQVEFAEIYQMGHSGRTYYSELTAKKTKEQLLQEEAEYKKVIQEADNFFGNGEYQKAIDSYNGAQNIMPSEQYPKQKIDECNTKLTEIKQKEEEAEYKKDIQEADKFFNNDEYQKAIDRYKNAQKIMPNEQYPKQKIDECNAKLAEIKQKKEKATQQFNESAKMYNQKEKEVEGLYVVEDNLKSAALGQTTYKTRKKHLYSAYEILKKDLESKIEKCNDIFKSNELIKESLTLIDKMIELSNTETRDLEKQLKKETDPQKIKEILGL